MKVYVRHKVKDFDAWKSVYDSYASAREGIGAENFKVFRNSKESTDVIVIADVTDVEKLKAQAKDNNLREMMRESGVAGMPEVLLLEEF